MTPPLPSRSRTPWSSLVLLVPAAVLVAVVATSWGAGGQDREPSPPNRPVLMRQKLDHARRILGGLAEGRFGPIARSARSLSEINHAALRSAPPTDEYLRFSDEFSRLSATLAERADARDLDGATLANARLTINCIECHKYVRIQTSLPPPPR